MKEIGEQEISVFEGDTAEQLANEFCDLHFIEDEVKKEKIKNTIDQLVTNKRKKDKDEVSK